MFKGGFSHVYLVRTPTPVYNTTHHVLKRIGVPNEAMLAEVKKEVDIMVRPKLLTRCLLNLPVEDTEGAPKCGASDRCCLAQNGDWHVRSLHSHGVLSRQVFLQDLHI